MKILILNQGSSSVKCAIYEFFCLPEEWTFPIWETKIEWKNIEHREKIGEQIRLAIAGREFDCVGHRIVHGGERYVQSARIDEATKREVQRFASVAPLHNLADLEGIKLIETLFPSKPQIAVFDTAFHHTIPEAAFTYPGPYEWRKQQIRRYGFHGTNFQYCTWRAKQILGKMPHRMIICHLGSGASLAAVKEGRSVDTTMGFTPLEGLMMDTRSGSVDPGVLLYLLRTKSPDALSHELNEKSGLLGLSGISSDMRDVLEKAKAGHQRAILALDVYVHRLSTEIGAMVASLGGLDALVFTAGIGENVPEIRRRACENLAFLGMKLSDKKTAAGRDYILSATESAVKTLIIHAGEEFEIARECWRVLN